MKKVLLSPMLILAFCVDVVMWNILFPSMPVTLRQSWRDNVRRWRELSGEVV